MIKYGILFLGIFLCFANDTYGQVTLTQVLDSIVQKGRERDVNMQALIVEHVNDIYIVKTLPRSRWDTKVLGRAVPRPNNRYDIYIIEEMFDNFFNAERVVIHEIGHALGFKHCCIDSYCVEIMSAQQAIDPEHILFDIAYNTSEYERSFDIFFDEVKLHYKSPRIRHQVIRVNK